MTAKMTSYERHAWEKLIADEQSRRSSWRSRGGDKVSELVSAAGDAMKKIPGADRVSDAIDDSVRAAFNGAAKAIFMPAISSVSMERRVRGLCKQYPDLGDRSPFKALDLQALDKGRPRQLLPFIGMVESAGASLAITGLEVSTTVSGGASAGAVILAIAGDVSASLALLGRALAEVAVHYGYDPNEPEEEIFLMGVLSYSTAASLEGKTAALAALSRLSQRMMRRAVWNELQRDVLVKVIQRVFAAVGLKLTQKRLAQVVPVAGGILSAGLSYDMLDRALRDATRVYRVRYLSEKHGLSFYEWVERATANEASSYSSPSASDGEPIDVELILQDAIEEEVPAGIDGANKS